jgi:hypothetical protein
MCSHLVHLAKTPVLTIDNRATQLSYSPTQTGGHKIVHDDDISIYTLEELERLESL